jgi:deoxycytidine triphosphate deaminase
MGRNGNAVLIQNFDRSQLEDLRDANATYDFRVGAAYKDHRFEYVTGLEPGASFSLLPGMAVVVQTEEEVDFPISFFGMIVPKVSLLHQGVSNTTSKIDPGYRGHLYISIFNLGKRPIPLSRGQKVCSLVMLRTMNGMRTYEKGSQSFRDRPAAGNWRTLMNFLEANAGVLTAMLIVVTIISIVFSMFVSFENRRLKSSQDLKPEPSGASTTPRGGR